MRNHPWPLHQRYRSRIREVARHPPRRFVRGRRQNVINVISVISPIEEGQTLCPNVKSFDTNSFDSLRT